jgi:hypothetical protein
VLSSENAFTAKSLHLAVRLLLPVGVLLRPRVTLAALIGALSPAALVLGVRYNFKMVRVDAVPWLAQVVNRHAFRDSHALEVKQRPMRDSHGEAVNGDGGGVAVLGQPSDPQPAGIRDVDSREEPRLRRKSIIHIRIIHKEMEYA